MEVSQLRSKLLILIVVLLTLIINAQVFADNGDGIELDGLFEDWADKPFVVDNKHDIKNPWLDFEQVRYYTDDEYLYLYVERLSANKSEPWNSHVVMLNAIKGNPVEQYPFGDEAIYAPQFDIVTHYDDNRGNNGIIVDVFFEGALLESTFSAENNAKVIEFRVPLEAVGLNGLNKDIQFMLKSEEGKKEDVDWVADGRPIIVTTGPTLPQVITILFFVSVSFMAYKKIKHKNKKVSFN